MINRSQFVRGLLVSAALGMGAQAMAQGKMDDVSVQLDCVVRADHAMFFVQGINKYGKKFTGERTQSVGYQPVQTPLQFVKTTKGGYRNSCFQLIHYTFNKQIEAISY